MNFSNINTMNMFQYISLLVAIFFIILYNIWRYNKNVLIPNWPIFGMLPSLLYNLSSIHDFITSILKHHGGTFHFKGLWFTNSTNSIFTSDAMNVQHITSKNFRNYGKGSDFHDIFEGFGVGIFNLDFDAWKQERMLLLSLLKKKNIEILLQKNIQKKLDNCLIPFLDHQVSKKVQELDLQDILDRFTFDITCNYLFGFDPNSLSYKFNEYSEEIASVIATSVIEDTLLATSVIEDTLVFRHSIPKSIWRLQKWLQIGQEAKDKVAQENLHKFLSKCINYFKHVEEKTSLRNIEDVDETHSCLLKELLLYKGLGKEEMVENDEKYLKDTAVNLLGAGNGTISSALSWFFWLVSNHPIVEAKIIQEIKDRFLKEESSLSVQNLDNLVYLHGAICETLRLYPSVPFQHKCAIKSDILPSGDHVRPNTKIIYSLYAMGRMEQIWGEDCLKFKPERWISDKGQVVHVPSYKFIAFNAGPRSCLGKDIAFSQMKMVAVAILWNFHIKVVKGQVVAPRISIVLRMQHGLKVKLDKRCI